MTTMLAAQGAEVTRAATPEDAVRAIAEDLRNHDLPSRLRMGADAQLAALPWDVMPGVERVFGPANGEDRAACRARLSRRRRPEPWSSSQGRTIRRRSPSCLRPISFWSRAGDVVGSYEEAFDRLRAIYGEGTLPRTVNLISGPSRTADIEQTIVRGAHGPKRLHVVILG